MEDIRDPSFVVDIVSSQAEYVTWGGYCLWINNETAMFETSVDILFGM